MRSREHGRVIDLPPASNNDLEARLRRVETDVAEIRAGLHYLIREAQEQARFRTRVAWAIGSAVVLLMLQSLGLQVSLGG